MTRVARRDLGDRAETVEVRDDGGDGDQAALAAIECGRAVRDAPADEEVLDDVHGRFSGRGQARAPVPPLDHTIRASHRVINRCVNNSPA